ncbi:efflux RND transporter permease subunit [Thermophagus xiamenensis]|uniref:Multidrug efflux pump subunit AcrB n=1 Tax=Thermophagus xiamenensis TaxID=385682 RepID=A0A1I2ETW2_9BACT|nr:efflux RND transporter permease subunit [Thermophagus xiamenensis]SFE95898.1 Multidrug efflux pump subunit AcrB [Thermophagus xiamenensis]
MTEFAFKNKTLIYFFLMVLAIGGIFSFQSMSKLEDPEIKVKQALVVTIYPGASAHEVELEVTDVLEKAIKTMGDIKQIESRSEADYSEIKVELDPTVSPEQIEQKWDLLRRKVSRAAASLPEGAQPPMVVDDFGDVYGLFYAMTSDGFSYEEMHRYGLLVKQKLEELPEVKRVEIYGDRKPCIYINMKQDRMANLGVHPAEVLKTLNDQHKMVYAGYFNAGNERIRVDVGEDFNNLNDIRNLIIQGHQDDQVKLSDIAEVEKALESPYREALRYNTKPALGISVAMQSGKNIIKLGDKVDKILSDLKDERIPAGIDFKKVFFQPEKVEEAISTFMFNLLQSIAIVVLILMLTMGWRSGYIIGFVLLLTILGSFVILKLFNGTLQRVSLASLIVAMGMLVDNAIVIVDGILVDLKNGMDKSKALLNTARKTAWPLLGATLIAIFAFLPIFLSPDTSGEYVRDLFIVLAVSLLLSWILALTQAPLMADKQFKNLKIYNNDSKPYSGPIYTFHRKFLSYLLYHKTIAIAIVTLLMGISALLFPLIPQTFFPDLNYNQLYIEYKMPIGTRIETVDKDLSEIENYLLKQPQITNVTTSLGGTPSRYNLVRSIAEPSMRYGELIVDFVDEQALKEKLPAIQDYLNTNYPQAYARVKRYNLMYKDFPIEVVFSGPDPAILKNLAAQAKAIMDKEPGAILVTDNWEPASKVMVAHYQQALARRAGLSRPDIALSLLTTTEGLPVGTFHEGTRSLPIYLKSTGIDGKQVDNLETAPAFSTVPSLSGSDPKTLSDIFSGITSYEDILESTFGAIPLNQAVKNIEVTWEEPVVRRLNGQRAIKAQCNTAPGLTADDVRNRIRDKIEAIPLPVGYKMEWQGEFQASSESQQYLFMYLPLAVVLMIALLIALFKDYKKPLIILLSLPLAFIGIVMGMLLTGKEFGFVAIVGALGLMGMMIKNGVVLLDEVELQLRQGKKPFVALMDASTSRLRPVMMASLTTIMGMIPLINDDMFGSMAVTMMSGLLIGSIITLMMVPVLYAIFFHVIHPLSKQAQKQQL